MAKKKQQYHYGRISTINKGTKKESFRVGPVTELHGNNYKGARPATYGQVLKMLKKLKHEDITVAVLGRLYPGRTKFNWTGRLFDREDLIDQLKKYEFQGTPIEDAVRILFNLQNGKPDLILAWEAREA